jgi:hypothetical protein
MIRNQSPTRSGGARDDNGFDPAVITARRAIKVRTTI